MAIVRAATLTYLINNPDFPDGSRGLNDYARDRPDLEPNDDLVYIEDDAGFYAAIYRDGSEETYRNSYHDDLDAYLAGGGTILQ